ncbi:uncharacterized protein PG986_002376 [Apiospora aurea]|uniref:Uncharacterized protein n=1 Tax=Apiospora aurea TaxID=335848 RepID=A0ABR1QZN8_9PEZI
MICMSGLVTADRSAAGADLLLLFRLRDRFPWAADRFSPVWEELRRFNLLRSFLFMEWTGSNPFSRAFPALDSVAELSQLDLETNLLLADVGEELADLPLLFNKERDVESTLAVLHRVLHVIKLLGEANHVLLLALDRVDDANYGVSHALHAMQRKGAGKGAYTWIRDAGWLLLAIVSVEEGLDARLHAASDKMCVFCCSGGRAYTNCAPPRWQGEEDEEGKKEERELSIAKVDFGPSRENAASPTHAAYSGASYSDFQWC